LGKTGLDLDVESENLSCVRNKQKQEQQKKKQRKEIGKSIHRTVDGIPSQNDGISCGPVGTSRPDDPLHAGHTPHVGE
jgi:hypothetical protein